MASGEERDVMGKMMTTGEGEKEGRKASCKGRKSMDHNPRALQLLQVLGSLKFLSRPIGWRISTGDTFCTSLEKYINPSQVTGQTTQTDSRLSPMKPRYILSDPPTFFCT